MADLLGDLRRPHPLRRRSTLELISKPRRQHQAHVVAALLLRHEASNSLRKRGFWRGIWVEKLLFLMLFRFRRSFGPFSGWRSSCGSSCRPRAARRGSIPGQWRRCCDATGCRWTTPCRGLLIRRSIDLHIEIVSLYTSRSIYIDIMGGAALRLFVL